jgi:hypothetical protein
VRSVFLFFGGGGLTQAKSRASVFLFLFSSVFGRSPFFCFIIASFATVALSVSYHPVSKRSGVEMWRSRSGVCNERPTGYVAIGLWDLCDWIFVAFSIYFYFGAKSTAVT